MIVPDINVLIYAMDTSAPEHERAWRWWESVLRGNEHIGFTWMVMVGYIRLATRHGGAQASVAAAIADTESWMALPHAHVLHPRAEHLHVVERLLDGAGRGGDLVPDAHLAALSMQHGGTVYSHDKDFGRFPNVPWVDPLA